ncbi:S-layer homology domain-containing protein [Lysinibacillus sp. Bpr_S20]|uniref:S-layer homology domain-containing protein n=1 Tax=Lysinibacillus sp. Bpr_S20 TaxID=2933964 RepID=UPI00201381BF|nr:S-layer homology domain-containing protein [Lysinibacillus sp. Bpr_S20]MCL1699726.1 S-layer homology domain-containing protein [Lysinibacillus sp. Bpr_S20]
MKKIVFFVFLLMAMSSVSVFAEGTYEDEVLSKAELWKENSKVTIWGEYKIEVPKEATYEFTFTDPTASYTTLDLNIGWGALVSRMETSKYDGDKSKTVHRIRLKKGTYDAHLYNKVSEVSYKIVNDIKLDTEPNNDYESANVIPLNTVIYGRNNQNSTDHDYFRFTLNEPKKVTLQLNEQFITTPGDKYNARLMDEKKKKILDLNASWYVNSSSAYLPAGTYYIEISTDPYLSVNKDYQFTVKTENLPNTVVEALFRPTILQYNQTVSGIVSVAKDYFDFDEYQVKHTSKNPFVIFTTSNNPISIELRKWDEQTSYYEPTPYKYTANGNKAWSQQLPEGNYQLDITTNASMNKDIDYTIRYESILFTDVTTNHPYRLQIEELANKEIVKGYGDAIFKPNDSILRKHVFSMISRIEGFELAPIREMKSFKDLSDQDSYYEIIKPFYEAGIIDGSGDNMNPNQYLTRAQLAKILVNAFDLHLVGEPVAFKDVQATNEFNPYIQILASHNITTGSNGNFMPNQPVSRQHFAVFLSRTLKMLNNE